ncbi:iron-containing redox enzyme family protein [Polyangium fumosum]|uniref:Iron-containing redox enzyme family protein n=1 Tax=Polyangium fumosum TaxID=889272 RepID=A0A4U1JEW8_9BACT|nr:iron-containing redox enzyme family protein [Polyangium fumosum]TKD09433.1 iron-containing redox enzyme family protein [Polyangium fumosum]
MIRLETLAADVTELQGHDWPPVAPFEKLAAQLDMFLGLDMHQQKDQLAALRGNADAYGAFLHGSLGTLYAYVLGYRDSPLFLATDDAVEARLHGAKIVLEREMLEHFLAPPPPPALPGRAAKLDYLEHLAMNNPGVHDPFFDFVADRATRPALREFLRCEVTRNEVVDDEVALLSVGLQGTLKKVTASNLWDECGNGNLVNFHTYWLRRLLERTTDWNGILRWRAEEGPWFSRISSNSFNMLLTRPGYTYRAYGSFLITEAWVEPHFERILAGLARCALDHPDIAVYFSRHVRIDPHHTAEMIAALRAQRPELSERALDEVILGAHVAIAAGTLMYRRLHEHLASDRVAAHGESAPHDPRT